MKVQKCCCWVPIDTGVVVLGFWMALSLLGELKTQNPFRAVATGTALVFFFIMQIKDTSENRKRFLYAFTWCVFTMLVTQFIDMYFLISDGQYIKQECENMQKDGTFKEDMITSMDECVKRITDAMWGALILGTGLLALLFWHFIRVVYTHWKGFAMSIEQHQRQIDEEEA